MFPSAKRAFTFLLRTPLIPAQQGPAAVELSTFTPAPGAGPSRLRAGSRTLSSMSVRPGREVPLGVRGYASDKGKKELYSDEAGSTGAGTDDVAHTDAAFDKNADPSSAAKQVENEAGKDFSRSPASAAYSQSPGQQGEKGVEKPLNTSKEEVKE